MEESPKKEQANVMAIICYLGFLCLIPILSKEKDEFVMFHARQGFVLFVLEIASWILGMTPVLFIIASILWVFWFVLSIIGIMNVVNHEKKDLPLIGKYAEKIKI